MGKVPNNKTGIGTRIKSARVAKHLSQGKLGKLLGVKGVTREMVSQYESEDVKGYVLHRIEQIAEACDVSPCWLAFNLGTREARGTEPLELLDVKALKAVIEEIIRYQIKNKRPIDPEKIAKLTEYCYSNLRPKKGPVEVRQITKLLDLVD
jgi:transcriptional regulator with XRE-family HTH domain